MGDVQDEKVWNVILNAIPNEISCMVMYKDGTHVMVVGDDMDDIVHAAHLFKPEADSFALFDGRVMYVVEWQEGEFG